MLFILIQKRGILERLFLLTITVNLLTAAAITDDDDNQIITTDATGMMIDADEVFTATGMSSDDDDEEFPAHDNDDLVMWCQLSIIFRFMNGVLLWS